MKNCKNCHFLAKEYRGDDGRSHNFSLSSSDRENIINIRDFYSLKCAKGVWDEGVEPTLINDRDCIINKINREDFCFHFDVHEGMLFEAASELQKRQEEYKKYNRNNLYTQIGLYIAATALIVDAIAELGKYIENIAK